MNILKWQTEEKFLANMMLLSNGMFLIISGWYFIADGYKSIAPTYLLMTGLMPLEAWGAIMTISGLLLAAAGIQTGKTRFICMIVGGLLGALMMALYAMASAEGATTYLVPLRYALMACFNLLIAALGGVEIWRKRRI